jgi:hypothetical protein
LNFFYQIVEIKFAPLFDVGCHGRAEHRAAHAAGIAASLVDHRQLKLANANQLLAKKPHIKTKKVFEHNIT